MTRCPAAKFSGEVTRSCNRAGVLCYLGESLLWSTGWENRKHRCIQLVLSSEADFCRVVTYNVYGIMNRKAVLTVLRVWVLPSGYTVRWAGEKIQWKNNRADQPTYLNVGRSVHKIVFKRLSQGGSSRNRSNSHMYNLEVWNVRLYLHCLSQGNHVPLLHPLQLWCKG